MCQEEGPQLHCQETVDSYIPNYHQQPPPPNRRFCLFPSCANGCIEETAMEVAMQATTAERPSPTVFATRSTCGVNLRGVSSSSSPRSIAYRKSGLIPKHGQ